MHFYDFICVHIHDITCTNTYMCTYMHSYIRCICIWMAHIHLPKKYAHTVLTYINMHIGMKTHPFIAYMSACVMHTCIYLTHALRRTAMSGFLWGFQESHTVCAGSSQIWARYQNIHAHT